MGKLAKADGIVTRNEADFVTELLRSLECPSELKKQLIASFNRGKTDSRSFVQCVRSVASFYPERERRQTLMRTYCILAIADGSLDEGTQHLLESAEEVFHLPGYLASFIRENCRTHTAEEEAETPHPNNAAALEEAYRLLEISPSASDDEVRRARRKKLMDYHPDRIQGKGLPETFLRFAAEETRKINDAYEIISAHRGMKS